MFDVSFCGLIPQRSGGGAARISKIRNVCQCVALCYFINDCNDNRTKDGPRLAIA